MIRFKKIFIEGFGSIVENQKFKLDRPGLNIIIAKNGSGKTSLFNAVYWTLFGQSLKGIKSITPWPEVQTKEYRGTINTIHFEDEKTGIKYQVIRCKDYKGKVEGSAGKDRLLLYKNGVYQTDFRDKNQVQEEVIRILGYSPDLFKNSIIFGQRLKRLIQETGPNKKKIFEEAFDAAFIKEGRDRAADKFKSTNSDFVEASVDYKLHKENLKQTKENLSQLEAQKTKFKNQKTKRINALNDELEANEKKFALVKYREPGDLQEDLRQRQQELGALSKLEQEIDDLESREFRETNLLNNLQSKLGITNNQILAASKAMADIVRKCPRCGQKLSSEKIRSEKAKLKFAYKLIKSTKIELKGGIEAQQGIVDDLLGKISSKKSDKEKIILLQRLIKTLELQLESSLKKEKVKVECDNIRKQIASIKKETIDIDLKPLIKKVKKLRGKKKKVKVLYKSLKKEVKNLKWAIDEVLGNKGLKAYIFDTRLKELNHRLQYYEQFIGYRVEFNVDLESANKDIFAVAYKNKHQHFYEELSGAQQQICDIATAFALHDLISEGKPLNFLVFDEVFEGLDEENVDIVNDLLRSKAFDKSIFLISHNIDLQSSSDKVIRLHLDAAGRTRLKLLS